MEVPERVIALMRRHGEPGQVELPATAPDTRGSSSPFSISVFVLGAVSMSLATIGLVAVQAYYALWGGTTVSQACIDRGIIPYTPGTATSPASGSQGALGVCHIVTGLTSSVQTTIWIVAIALGVVSVVLGWGFYRRMDTRRRRDQMIAGAVLGLQGTDIRGAPAGIRFRTAGEARLPVLQHPGPERVRLDDPHGDADHPVPGRSGASSWGSSSDSSYRC